MSKRKQTSETTGLTGTLETANDWIHETDGTKVQNPNQNNQIHKQSLGATSKHL